MASVASRYIFRETAQTWLAVTAVLLLILVTSQFAQVLGDAAANHLPKDAVLQVMVLTSVQYLTILVPVALFLSILLALGRLYRDSEMYALMACGVGPAKLYRPLLAFAGVLAIAVGWVALDVAPGAMLEVSRIAQETRARSDLRMMEAGRFVSFGQAEAAVYAESVGADGHLRNVFVQRRTNGKVEVVVAAEAWQRETADPNLKMLVFREGRRYEGEPGSAQFTFVEFTEHGIPYSLPQNVAIEREPASRPFSELLDGSSPAELAEIQWRASVPVMSLVLAFLAVPLARSSPRQGRYAGLGAALLIYVCYANLLGAARVWVERGRIPIWLGLWWVHAVFLLGAIVLLIWRFGGIHWSWQSRRARAQS